MRAFVPLAVALLIATAAVSARAESAAATRAFDAWQAGDLEHALAESGVAVIETPDSPYAWTLRGFLLSTADRKEEALDAYSEAAELVPSDALVRNNLGVVLMALGRYAEAEAEFRQAIALDGDYADARNNLGAALEKRGARQRARRAYGAAAALDPGHARAFNNLGVLAWREGRVEEAVAAFRRAAVADPSLGAAAINLHIVGGGTLEDEASYHALLEAAAVPGASAAVRARALAARADREALAGRQEEARALYVEALAFAPDDPVLLNNLAVTEDRLGLDREALLHLGEALRLRPRMIVARNNMGIVHAHREDHARAAEIFRQILAVDDTFHRAHYNLGVVLAAEGRLQEALGSFERASTLAPWDGDVRYNLELLRRRLGGTPEQELAGYEAALAADDELAEAHLAIGCLLADPQTPPELRDEARARRHLERFLALTGDRDPEGRAEAESWLAWLRAR